MPQTLSKQNNITNKCNNIFYLFCCTEFDCHCPANSTGGMCRAGTFCPQGSSEPTPCTPGEILILNMTLNLNLNFLPSIYES